MFDVTNIFDATKITEQTMERLERTEGHAGDEQALGRARSSPRLRSLEITAPLYESIVIKQIGQIIIGIRCQRLRATKQKSAINPS